MFKTIRAKILFITFSMLTVLSIVFVSFILIMFGNVRELLITSCDYTVSAFTRDVNKDIIRIESNVLDLALLGEMYYSYGKNKQMLDYAAQEIFEVYPPSLGGGIWFKPYQDKKNQRLSCVYFYRDKLNNTRIDREFEGEEYDYPNQKWYKEIVPGLKKEWDVKWSSPYHEEQGSDSLMVTVGTGIYDMNDNMVGISTVDWGLNSISKMLAKAHPTPNSFALFADLDNDYVLATTDKYTDNNYIVGRPIKDLKWYNENLHDNSEFIYHGKRYISFFKRVQNNMLLVVNVPAEELFYMAAKYFIIMFCILMLIGIFINALLYLVLDRNMSKPIDKLIRIANKIRKGELDTEIKLEKPEEFANLASTFDKMANDIKNITKEREKIESELTLAKTIQESSVPNKFPAYPDRTEFDIYAKMYPAKEVGGDFYDFYFTDEENFMFLIADVSGKGVPAALSMMNIITLINVTAHLKYSPSEMFDYINKKVCANSRGLFVTLFACIVNVNTGKLTCINCGHNHPLLKQNGKYNYLKTDSNIVLGAFPDAVFNIYETTLNKDDEIFLYTDGVTEAHNAESEMYGEERLLNTLNNYTNSNLANVIANVKSDLKNFTQNMPQYDDTTMLIFRYKKDNTSSNIFRSKAEKENYSDFRNWVNKICDEGD